MNTAAKVLLGEPRERLLAVGGDDDVEVLLLEQLADDELVDGMVLGDEHERPVGGRALAHRRFR